MRYTVETENLHPNWVRQGIPAIVTDTQAGRASGVPGLMALCYRKEDAERIAEALNAAEEGERNTIHDFLGIPR
jgi:hypothetical protein